MGWFAYTPLSDTPLGTGVMGTGVLGSGARDTSGAGQFLSNEEFIFPALSRGGLAAVTAVLVLVAGVGMAVLSRRRSGMSGPGYTVRPG